MSQKAQGGGETTDFPIKFAPPDEIKDKNGLLGWIIRTARSTIKDSPHYSWELDPLGDIEVLNPTEAAKYIWVDQTNWLHFWMRKYEAKTGKKIKSVSRFGQKWEIFLSDDLRPLKIFYEMSKGKIDPEKIK